MGWKQSLGWRRIVGWGRANRKLAGWLGVGIGISLIALPIFLSVFDVRIPGLTHGKVPGIKVMVTVGVVWFVFGAHQLKKLKKENAAIGY
jgi:amino acid transporter